MPIETDCPGCARRLRVDEAYAGRQARCPICSQIYTVPLAAAPQAAAPVGAAAQSGYASSYGPSSNASAVAPSAYSPSGDTANWWLRTPEGKSYGPVAKVVMNGWVAEGRVTSDCMLRRADAAWEPADRHYPNLREKSSSLPIQPYGGAASAPPLAQSHTSGISYVQGGSYAGSGYKSPHRGTTILVLAIIGLVMGCPILSVMAWVMGSADMQEINAGRMDPEGMSSTKTGYLIGMIYSLIWIAMLLLMLPLMFAACLAGAL